MTPGDHEAVVARARVLAAAPALRARAQGERASGDREIARLLAERMGVDAAADQRPLVAAAAMSAAAVAAWDHWFSHGGTGDPGRAIAAALELVTQGVEELDDIHPRNKSTRRR